MPNELAARAILPNGATIPVMTIEALHIMMCCRPIGVEMPMAFLNVCQVGLNVPRSMVSRSSLERKTR